jgi:hypothetical protein
MGEARDGQLLPRQIEDGCLPHWHPLPGTCRVVRSIVVDVAIGGNEAEIKFTP